MININGVDYIQCDLCEKWREANQLCKCLTEKKSEELRKILEIGRANNRRVIFCIPSNGMSCRINHSHQLNAHSSSRIINESSEEPFNDDTSNQKYIRSKEGEKCQK